MKDAEFLELLQEANTLTGLNLSLIEKDWYVVMALSAITSIDRVDNIKLVFCGGTALSRAHRIIDRMSEDIDFKLISNNEEDPIQPASIRKLRVSVCEALQQAGFDCNLAQHFVSKNNSKYNQFTIPYNRISSGSAVLRPELLIELTANPIKTHCVTQNVSSFIASAYNWSPEISSIDCLNVIETAAEKLIALTRRVGEEKHHGVQLDKDKTIVRHIYDLHVILNTHDIHEIVSLSKIIMVEESKTRGSKFPPYRDNPLEQTLAAIEILHNDSYYSEKYDEFHKSMVYADQSISFDTALSSVAALGDALRL